MNTPNNKRRRDSVRKIEKTFIELLQEKPLKEISVADICQGCGLNRSTFYANFVDIYDLADKLRLKLEAKFAELFSDFDPTGDTDSALRLFTHIRENQSFYQTYFKLSTDGGHRLLLYSLPRAEEEFGKEHLKYHREFFRCGVNAIVRLWLEGGCAETPEEMAEILRLEYRGRQTQQ